MRIYGTRATHLKKRETEKDLLKSHPVLNFIKHGQDFSRRGYRKNTHTSALSYLRYFLNEDGREREREIVHK